MELYNMTNEAFERELKKYSKDEIMQALLHSWIRDRRQIILKANTIRFDALMKLSDEIQATMRSKDTTKLKQKIEWLKLMEDDRKLHLKINKTLKDMDISKYDEEV